MLFQKGWNDHGPNLKNQLIKSLEDLFRNNIFDSALLLKRASKHTKIVTNQYRRGLRDNTNYEHPPMIPPMEWNEIIEDEKKKRLHGKENQLEEGKRR